MGYKFGVFQSINTYEKKIQRVQNLVMCWVLSRPFWTKITGLLDEMNWLSMFQLSCYHSLLLLWKIKEYKTPHNNFKNIEKSKMREEEYNWQVEYGVLELPLEITKCDKISILKNSKNG